MTFREALAEGSNLLAASADDTPYLDALVLLCDAAGVTKERLYGLLADPVPTAYAERFHRSIERRVAGVPVAYLIRRKEFYGREFYVDERVLIPRADTETLVEAALEAVERDAAIRRVHDLGTGSGCIALTLKAERPDLEVSASDASSEACEVFAINAGRLGFDVILYETPFFEGLRGPFDMVVSNPPYLTDSEADGMKAAGWPEPQEALRSGSGGLDHIAQVIDESVHFMRTGGRIVLEASPTQMPKIRELLHEAGYGAIATSTDLAGRERVVSGVRNG